MSPNHPTTAATAPLMIVFSSALPSATSLQYVPPSQRLQLLRDKFRYRIIPVRLVTYADQMILPVELCRHTGARPVFREILPLPVLCLYLRLCMVDAFPEVEDRYPYRALFLDDIDEGA